MLLGTFISAGLAAFLAAGSAQAQFSEADIEGSSRFSLLGKTWSPTFYSLASLETDRANDAGGRLSTYNYFSFHTSINGDIRFSFRVPFTYSSAGTDRFSGERNNEQETALQDVILEARDTEVAFLPWDLQLYWAGRVYLPNSKFSKQSGQIARFRNHFILSKVFSRHFEAEAQQRFNYFWQSRTAYPVRFQDEDGFEVNTSTVTKRTEAEHWLSMWGKLSAKAGFGWSLISKDTYYNKSKAENRSKPGERLLKTGPQVRFPVGDKLDFIFSYQDVVNRDENAAEFGRFLAKNTEFVLHSFVNF